MANISQYLTKADRLNWSRFLSSDSGKKGLAYLTVGFPKAAGATTAADLLNNSLGFDGWTKCITAMENIGDVPVKTERVDDDQPLEQ